MQAIVGPIHVLRVNGRIVSKIFAYMDDILIASISEEYHLRHMEQLFGSLGGARLTLSAKKCEFFKVELPFLGHIVTKDGL